MLFLVSISVAENNNQTIAASYKGFDHSEQFSRNVKFIDCKVGGKIMSTDDISANEFVRNISFE